MTDAIAALIPMLATVLLHFLWQGTLIGVLAWMLLSALHAARPQLRYAVACAALLACVLLPVLTFAKLSLATTIDGGAATLVQPSIAPATGAAVLSALSSSASPLQPWIVALWAAGAGTLLLRMTLGLCWVQRLRNRPTCGDARHWQACVEQLAHRFDIRRRVAVRVIDDGDSPLSIGWWKPMVLLPAAIIANMPAPLLEALIAHELAHIRRHDYLLNLLQGMAEALLFYHPAIWWLSHRIRIERELIADDLAARQLGDSRRLAIALAELDRLGNTRSPAPPITLAQAAHGGQLMSRIKQLLRPEHRIVGGTLLLPAVGIVALGMAFQAYAQLGTPTPPAQTATTKAALPPPPPAPPSPPLPANNLPAPPAPPAVPPPPAPPPAPPAPPAPPVKGATLHGTLGSDGYALVHKGAGRIEMMGNSIHADTIQTSVPGIAGDFLWFRRDGQTWVVRDADVLARANQAWASSSEYEAKMRALEARMQPHQARLDALNKRMEALNVGLAHTPQMAEAEQSIHAIAERQRALAERQQALARQQMRATDAAGQAQLEQAMAQFDAQQQALDAEIQHHSVVLQRQQQRTQAVSAKMQAVAREMQAASQPMEAIGKDMEALGKQLERQSAIADRQVRQLIDEAVRRGLAQPVSSLQ